MVRKLVFSIILSVLALSQLAGRTSYTPATVPNVQLWDYTQFVSNPDGILSQSAVDEINRMCLDLKEKGIAQVAVLVLGYVDEKDLDMFAHEVLNLWGVGQKGKDNGLVVSVVKEQRDIQFETGYGLEGVLPDAICKRIQTLIMAPRLKEGDWDAGVLEGVREVYNILTGNPGELGAVAAAEDNAEDAFPPLFLLLLLLPVCILIFLFNFVRRRINTCPACGARGGLSLVSSKVVNRTRSSEIRENVYRCTKCGHTLTRRNTNSTGGGTIIGGGFGGGGFGGSRGGGFGGGMSGGGGARSGF